MPDPIETEGWHPGFNPWVVALTVTIATFMEIMDTSIANVALPHIAGGLSAGVDESTWVLTSYLVSNAVVLPISAWASDRFGRKRFYMTCVALFTISSFLCGLAPSLGMLVFFRILQGAGGGGLGPSEQAILADTFPPAKRGMAFAVYGMAVVLAPAIGPTLGGWITDHYSWRWIFYVNIPFGLLSLSLTSMIVRDPPRMERTRHETHKPPVDFLGLVLVATGLGALQVVLDKGQRDDWFASSFITTFTVVSLCALTIFVIWEWNHDHPIVDLCLFKHRSFAVAAILLAIVFACLLGTTVLLPQFAQMSLGYTAEKAGEILSPGAFALVFVMPVIGVLVSRYDARYLIGFGLVIMAVATFHMSNVYLGIDYRTLMLWRVYQAIGMAFLFVPINTMSYNGIPSSSNNQVSGLMNLMRNVGGSVGISAVETLLARRQQVHQFYLARHVPAASAHVLSTLNAIASRLTDRVGPVSAARQAYGRIYLSLQRQATTLAFGDIFMLLGVVALASVIFLFFAGRTRPGKASMGH